GIGSAALAGSEASTLRGRCSRIKPHVAGERRPDRAAGPAIDLRGQHCGDEPAVESGVLGLDGPVAAVEVFVHASNNYTCPPTSLAENRHRRAVPGSASKSLKLHGGFSPEMADDGGSAILMRSRLVGPVCNSARASLRDLHSAATWKYTTAMDAGAL